MEIDAPDRHIWIIGKVLDVGWIAQGIFLNEDDAIGAAKEDEFVILVDTINMRLPRNVHDSRVKKLYWPHYETWETSKLYEARNGIVE